MLLKLLSCLCFLPWHSGMPVPEILCEDSHKSVSYRIPQESLPLVPVCEIAIFSDAELVYSFPLEQGKKSWTRIVVSLKNVAK